jgi:hypothetical protein
MQRAVLAGCLTLLALLTVGCNGTTYGVLQPNPEDLCKCLPIEPDILDFRHLAKHVPIPAISTCRNSCPEGIVLDCQRTDEILASTSPRHLRDSMNSMAH